MLLIILSKINIFRVQLVSGYSNTRIKPFYLIYLMLGTFFFSLITEILLNYILLVLNLMFLAKNTIPEK